jgi:hypothetical protein
LAALDGLIKRFSWEAYRECYRIFLKDVAVVINHYISPIAGCSFSKKSAELRHFKPGDMRILKSPNAKDLEWILAENDRRLALSKSKCE